MGAVCSLIWFTVILHSSQAIILGFLKAQVTRQMTEEGRGRPDLRSIAWELNKSDETDAVFPISNSTVTRKVMYRLESRGVPAFGPI
ncbi:hypothetical protein NA56DRAFT_649985 [Hyaloscypha hepaticicola]|uniref:Uncharacterized protein n=1 Tax=Hyaloscypha hepaticicola TaxID=2082293 RepID=A0A2J6PNZ0_9HELO|nr:hypothetical protein NA56DRAFT_649985 [Hyaloscypha hepaticicola]